MQTPALIANARTALKLSAADFALITGLSEDRLTALEAGAEAETRELSRIARAMGIELEDFFDGKTGDSSVFFRQVSKVGLLRERLEDGDGLALGDFVRHLRRVKALRVLLGRPQAPPTWLEDVASVPLLPHEHPATQGRALAEHARAYFGLGVAPIPSMRQFLEDHGISVVFAMPTELSHAIAGASTLTPTPAVLVNTHGAELWRQRATMAHELCHLLHDRQHRSLFAVSPRSDRRRRQDDSPFVRMEQRANAFNAYFLAPKTGVEAFMAKRRFDMDSERGRELAAKTVAGHFGVSYTTAVNVMATQPGLDDSMFPSPSDTFVRGMTYDEATENIGIHNGELKALTLQALASGRIDAYQARQYLDLRLSERLPTGYGVADEDARPLVTLRRRAMNRVVSWLVAEGLDATYWFTSVERTPSGWAAQIFDEDDAPAGRVLLSRDLETAEFRPA